MSDNEEIKRRLTELENTDKEISGKVHEIAEVLREILVTNKYLQENLTKLSNVNEKLHQLERRVDRNEDTSKVTRWSIGIIFIALVGAAVKYFTGM